MSSISLNNVEILGFHSFSNLPITNLTIPSTVKTIERRAFSDCLSLESIEWPNIAMTLDQTFIYNNKNVKKCFTNFHFIF